MARFPPPGAWPDSAGALAPREAYDTAAPCYDEWRWQKFWRRNELPLVADLLRGCTAVSRCLDMGTGTGAYLRLLQQFGGTSVGVDLSLQMLLQARRRLGDSALLVQGDATALCMATASFDLVVCCRVLSHVRAMATAVHELSRVLRSGGIALITDVSSEHAYTRTRLPVGTGHVLVDTHKWSDRQLESAAESAGLRLLHRRRITVHDLRWRPEAGVFASLDDSGCRAVSYIMMFSKG